MEMIDNRSDFRVFMDHYVYARGNSGPRGPRREGPVDEGFVRISSLCISDYRHLNTTLPQLPPIPTLQPAERPAPREASVSNGVSDAGHPTFGIDLGEQMTRDDVEVPLIVQKCCEAIEKYGIRSQGIYRISGTTSKIQTLKQKLDRGEIF